MWSSNRTTAVNLHSRGKFSSIIIISMSWSIFGAHGKKMISIGWRFRKFTLQNFSYGWWFDDEADRLNREWKSKGEFQFLLSALLCQCLIALTVHRRQQNIINNFISRIFLVENMFSLFELKSFTSFDIIHIPYKKRLHSELIAYFRLVLDDKWPFR